MPGKQVRIDANLLAKLQCEADRHNLTISKYIEQLIKESQAYKSLLIDVGFDLRPDQGRLVGLSMEAWARLNSFRADYIKAQPTCTGDISSVVLHLLEGADHESDRSVAKCPV